MITSSLASGEQENDKGLVSGHSYSITSLHEFTHDGEKVKLLRLRNPWDETEWEGDWSDSSEKWTAKLRVMCGSSVTDEGYFFIPLCDYQEEYYMTSVSVVDDPRQYQHSQLLHDFNHGSDFRKYQAFYRIHLHAEVDCTKSAFCISVFQQGDRLGCYRNPDFEKAFQPSEFNIILMKESGEFIAGCFGADFMQTLQVENRILPEG